MRLGRFRHRVGILEPQRGVGASGAPTTTYDRVATRWADVTPLSGKEQTELERVEARVTFLVKLRFYDGLTTKHRLELADGRVLELQDLRSPMERRAYHEALCTEVVVDGV